MLAILKYVIDVFFFFFNDTATTEIYTLSLHDALPISKAKTINKYLGKNYTVKASIGHVMDLPTKTIGRSEEHTSELQSHLNLVCRLLLEKKKTISFSSISDSHSIHIYFIISPLDDLTY